MRVRYRVGTFGAVNAVLGAVFLMMFAALVVVCGIEVWHGVDVGWSCIGGAIALLAAIFSGGMVASGISTRRPVILSSTSMSVPGFTLRRGLYREEIPTADISDVELTYFSQPRNGRWHLVVTRRHGRPLACDSITSSRSSSAQVQDTPAWQAVQELRSAIRAAQHAAR